MTAAAEHKIRITVITTGGTIEKTYDESAGLLENRRSNVAALLDELRLPDLDLELVRLFNKDSLDMKDEDRALILQAVQTHLAGSAAVLIIHGTDTLATTGDLLHSKLSPLRKPVVLTGAMKPMELVHSDALQNVTEALLACRLMPPGVYVTMHNRVLAFPGVVKDRQRLSFKREEAAS